MSTTGEIKRALEGLVSRGQALKKPLRKTEPEEALKFAGEYQGWYTEALAVMKALVPERLAEFRESYERDPKRKVFNALTYTLQDFTQAMGPPTELNTRFERVPTFDVINVAYIKLNTQVDILKSALTRFDSILADIRGVLQADLFDSELEAARHLADNGHIRAAGALAGVTLEAHLSELTLSHAVSLRKKSPTIADYDEALKSAGVFDVTQWRWVQRLADIRNLCDHKKARDPTPDEVKELIDGVDRAVKTLS